LQKRGDVTALKQSGSKFLGEKSGMALDRVPIRVIAEVRRQMTDGQLQHDRSSFS
jgi:hypothetical protein